jgi:hypothetical protein
MPDDRPPVPDGDPPALFEILARLRDLTTPVRAAGSGSIPPAPCGWTATVGSWSIPPARCGWTATAGCIGDEMADLIDSLDDDGN